MFSFPKALNPSGGRASHGPGSGGVECGYLGSVAAGRSGCHPRSLATAELGSLSVQLAKVSAKRHSAEPSEHKAPPIIGFRVKFFPDREANARRQQISLNSGRRIWVVPLTFHEEPCSKYITAW
jgi:hypothetical protein